MGKLVILQTPTAVHVLPDDPLGNLHPELGALVAVRVVGTGKSVVDSPLLEEGLGDIGDKLEATVSVDGASVP